MTDSELLAAIEADPAARALADAGDDAGAAARLRAILPPALASVYVNERAIFAAFPDPADAEAVMQGLEAVAKGDPDATPPVPGNPTVARSLAWLRPNNGGIDLANAAARAMLDQLAGAGILAASSVATLKALAESPAAVSAGDVSRACLPNRPNGKVV